eukprot:GGOE01005445.1.p1 GENE.GGOE01005445.1~~GGOE01005445.1.p1  ORF type:complete len:603 (+),score=152.34 GGOE01005445.1:129-1811(+)
MGAISFLTRIATVKCDPQPPAVKPPQLELVVVQPTPQPSTICTEDVVGLTKDQSECSSKQDTKRQHREAAMLFLTSIEAVDTRRRQNSSSTTPGLLPAPSLSMQLRSPRSQRKPALLNVQMVAEPQPEDSGLLGNLFSPDIVPKPWAVVEAEALAHTQPSNPDVLFDMLRPEPSASPTASSRSRSGSSSNREEPDPERILYFASQRSRENALPFAMCTFLPYYCNRSRRPRSIDQVSMAEENLHASTPPHPFKTGKARRGRNMPTYYRHLLWPSGQHRLSEVDDENGGRSKEKADEKVEDNERLEGEDGDKHDTKRAKAEKLRRTLTEYDPLYLDDPDKKCEKRRKLLCLTSYRTSIIPYVKKKDLKASINEQLLFTHPWIEDLHLTLTAIRKIKNIMMNLTGDTLEVSTIAYAVVYFEKIILKKRVNKENRKLMAAICVMLAVKFWEPSITSETRLDSLVELLEESFGVTRKRLFAMEMTVFAELDFRLLLPGSHVYPHFVRLLAEHYGLMPQEYAPIMEDPAVTQPGYHFPDLGRGPEKTTPPLLLAPPEGAPKSLAK